MQVCGICKRSPRPDEDHKRVRLTDEDMVDQKYPQPKKPGLYQCCQECFETYHPIVAKRLGHEPHSMPHHHCI